MNIVLVSHEHKIIWSTTTSFDQIQEALQNYRLSEHCAGRDLSAYKLWTVADGKMEGRVMRDGMAMIFPEEKTLSLFDMIQIASRQGVSIAFYGLPSEATMFQDEIRVKMWDVNTDTNMSFRVPELEMKNCPMGAEFQFKEALLHYMHQFKPQIVQLWQAHRVS